MRGSGQAQLRRGRDWEAVIWAAGLGGGAGGIGRRDWEAAIWASGVPGTSLWQRLLAAPGGGAVVARGACVSGKGKGARDVLRRVGRKVASCFLDKKNV